MEKNKPVINSKKEKEPSDGLVAIDLGEKSFKLGGIWYQGKMRVSKAIADQLRSMIPFGKSQPVVVNKELLKK